MEEPIEYDGINEIDCFSKEGKFDCKLYHVKPDRERSFIVEVKDIVLVESDTEKTMAQDNIIGLYLHKNIKCTVLELDKEHKMLKCGTVVKEFK